MRNYYLAFVILTFVVVLTLFKGFSAAGSPFAQKAINEDANVLSQMSNLKYDIDSHYQKNGQLPESLDKVDLVTSRLNTKDNKRIDYKVKDDNTFSLCADFLTDTRSQSTYDRNYQSTYVAGKTVYHSKGYDCIDFDVVSYNKIPTPYVKPQPTGSPQTIFGTVDSVAVSSDNPRLIVKDNQMLKVISLKDAVILDKDGKSLKYESFQAGDKVIVDGEAGSSYLNIKASRVQNLTR